MESKKVNIAAFFLMIVMSAFAIYIGIYSRGKDGANGRNGYSNYELAVKNHVISSDMSETEYLKSLYGKDGSSVTLEDIYNAYLSESGKTREELTYTDFILTYYPDKIVSESESISLIENSTQDALRSTVDICYGYYMDTSIIYGNYSGDKFIIDSSMTYKNKYASIGVSAGSGVIYKYDDTDGDGTDDVAYIITNYHVVYCSNYSNSSEYYVYYDEQKNMYFTATYDENNVKTGTETRDSFFGLISSYSYSYIDKSSIEMAPIYTHFLDKYGIYLYGYQYEKYELSATFVGGSSENDIAILKIDKNDVNSNNKLIFENPYKSATIGDSSELSNGETIVAVGNPLLANTSNIDSSSGVKTYVDSAKSAYVDALCLTSTSGEVSYTSENCEFSSIISPEDTINMRLIRVSSAINAGNSGGGLYDVSGKLVGIVNGKVESASYDNVGYAIPVNIAKRIADQIIEQCDDENEKTTRIKITDSNKLGLELENGISSPEYDVNTLKWKLKTEVVVKLLSTEMVEAGFKSGDILESIEIDGETYDISLLYDVDDILLCIKDSSEVKFNILRSSEGSENFEKLSIQINLLSEYFYELV